MEARHVPREKTDLLPCTAGEAAGQLRGDKGLQGCADRPILSSLRSPSVRARGSPVLFCGPPPPPPLSLPTFDLPAVKLEVYHRRAPSPDLLSRAP